MKLEFLSVWDGRYFFTIQKITKTVRLKVILSKGVKDY